MEEKLNNKYSIIVNKKRRYNADDFKDFKYINITSTDGRNILIEEVTNIQFNKLKEEMKKLDKKLNYMTVPAAIKELEKI